MRINPGQLPGAEQDKFDGLMREMISLGKPVWSSPDVQIKMGAKDALCKIANLNCGLPDTLAYYSVEEFTAGFKKTMAYQPRVVKQNRGSSGEGIWIIKLKDKEYCQHYGDAMCEDSWMLDMMEANDNHQEFHTVGEFVEFCVNGRNDKSGTWTTKGVGKYLEGGKEAGGQLVDQRLLPRIDEGEVRILMAGDTCQMAIHKKPTGGGLSAVGGNSDYTYYKPDDPKYKNMVQTLYKDIPTLLPCMDLDGEPLPLLWTADYIPKNPEGWTEKENAGDDKTEYVVGEFNCSCVGISKFQAVCGGSQTLADVSDEDYYDACELTDLMGVKAIEMIDKAKAK